MKWIDRLEFKFRRFGLENLMIYVVSTMLVALLAEMILGLPVTQWISLDRAAVLRGEVWRLITFIFQPPATSPIWVFISLYFYYFIGSSLENAWGASKFTIYYAFGILGAIIAGMITGYGDNAYLNLSLFLAFAQLYPDQQLLLFFVIPVKVKYLAYVDWALLGIAFLLGGWPQKAAVLASILNFFLFFGRDFWDSFNNWRRYGKRRRQFKRDAKDYRDFWR